MSTLTKSDRDTLDACQSYDSWRAACNTIQGRHDGQYPSDWHSIVVRGGLGNTILARWGMDMGFRAVKIEVAEDLAEGLAEARKKLEFAAHPLVQCKGCNKFPDQLEEYVAMVDVEPEAYKTATDAAKTDGSYNRATGQFYCTGCYLEAGCPPGKA